MVLMLEGHEQKDRTSTLTLKLTKIKLETGHTSRRAKTQNYQST